MKPYQYFLSLYSEAVDQYDECGYGEEVNEDLIEEDIQEVKNTIQEIAKMNTISEDVYKIGRLCIILLDFYKMLDYIQGFRESNVIQDLYTSYIKGVD